METAYGNKLITEFMGKKFSQDNIYIYHYDWSELMRVVEKIEEEMLAYAIWIEGHSCRIQITSQHPDEGGKQIEHEAKTKIRAVWGAVIEFIIWHNKNTPQ